jgi:hypothetical protein
MEPTVKSVKNSRDYKCPFTISGSTQLMLSQTRGHPFLAKREASPKKDLYYPEVEALLS